jgi:hypothetical protein
MTKASLSLHLDDSTTYATVFQGEQPVASVRRKRMYGEADRKTWTVYDMTGAELFQTNLGSVTIRSRVSSILKAREEAKALVHAPEPVRLNCNHLAAYDRLVQAPLEAICLARPDLNTEATRAYLIRKNQALKASYLRQRFGHALFTGR